MSDDLQTQADQSFREFGAAMSGFAVPEDGVIPQVYRDFQAVQEAKASLDHVSREIADQMAEDHEEPWSQERDARIRLNQDVFDAAERSFTKQVQTGIAKVKASLSELAVADLPAADPGERSLIRQEIQTYTDAVTASPPRGVGEPAQGGRPMALALLDMARRNPDRYAAEVASDFGTNLMMTAGKADEIPALRKAIREVAPATTPKAKHARAVLDVMERSKVEGHAGVTLGHVARQRVAAVAQPARPQQSAFRTENGRVIP